MAEKRLIDADKIYDAVERRYQISSGIEHRCERDLLDLICAADTVDAVEVVRCKDCKKYRYPFCLLDDTGKNGFLTNRKADDFCSYGERREGEE